MSLNRRCLSAVRAGGARRSLLAGARARLGGTGGRLAPQLLQAVELARLGREDVHDHVEVVHQDPAGGGRALDPARQRVVLVLEPLEDAVVDSLRLAAGVAGADEEVVGVAEHPAQIELDDVDRLLVGRQTRDLADEPLALQRPGAPAPRRRLAGAHRSTASAPARYRRCSATYAATAGPTSASIGSPAPARR